MNSAANEEQNRKGLFSEDNFQLFILTQVLEPPGMLTDI